MAIAGVVALETVSSSIRKAAVPGTDTRTGVFRPSSPYQGPVGLCWENRLSRLFSVIAAVDGVGVEVSSGRPRLIWIAAEVSRL